MNERSWSSEKTHQRDAGKPPTAYAGLALLLLATWLFIFPRVVPNLDLDRGIFVSVAERLLAGDRLYVQVFDNKEPLFYFLVAAQRALGSLAEPIAELILLLIASLSIFFIVSGRDKFTATLVGFIITPLVLTGRYYLAGHTHLPGIALCLAAYSLAYNRKFRFAGITVAILLFTKLIFAPLAMALCIYVIYCKGKLRDFFNLALGFSSATVFLLALLSWRGELVPFLTTILHNMSYANGPLIDAKGWGTILGHARRVFDVFVVVVLAGIALVLGIAWSIKTEESVVKAFGAAILAVFLSMGLLLTTGLWDHHNQVLYIPAVLVAVCGAEAMGRIVSMHKAVSSIVAIGLAWTLGGLASVNSYTAHHLVVPKKISALNALSPEAAGLLMTAERGSYARLGMNDDLGHASGLEDWTLLCPKFHQYFFESAEALDEALACAAKAPRLIVSGSLHWPLPSDRQWPAWGVFLENIEELLRASFDCDSAGAGLRICTKHTNGTVGRSK